MRRRAGARYWLEDVILRVVLCIPLAWVIAGDLSEGAETGTFFGLGLGTLQYFMARDEEPDPGLPPLELGVALALAAALIAAMALVANALDFEPHSIERWGTLGAALIAILGVAELRYRAGKSAPEASDAGR